MSTLSGPDRRTRTSSSLAAGLRDQVDLDALARQLLDTARSTVRPTRLSLWVRRG